jgi:type VI protein secretion system component Hcp
MQESIRRAVPIAVAAALAGCSFSSGTTPFAGSSVAAPQSAAAAANAARSHRTNVIYSSRVTFAGPDGRRYAGDAVVFPKGMFAGLHLPGLSSAAPNAAPHTSSLSYYLEVPGTKGAITAPDAYRGWIGVDSFSIGYGSPAGSHRAVTDLVIVKPADTASPLLINGVFTGNVFTGNDPVTGTNVTELDVTTDVSPKPVKSMYFTFTKPIATSFETDYSSGGAPEETVTIQYATAKFCVIPLNAAGQPQTAVCNTWTPGPA